MFAAFLYADYYCNGVKASYAGLWRTEDEAKESIHGTRYDKLNLEIMDLETCGISVFRWRSTYKRRETYICGQRKEYLKHRWLDEPEIEIEQERFGEAAARHQLHILLSAAGDWVPTDRWSWEDDG